MLYGWDGTRMHELRLIGVTIFLVLFDAFKWFIMMTVDMCSLF